MNLRFLVFQKKKFFEKPKVYFGIRFFKKNFLMNLRFKKKINLMGVSEWKYVWTGNEMGEE